MKEENQVTHTHANMYRNRIGVFFLLYVVLVCKEERQTNSVHKRNRYTSKQVKTEKNIYVYESLHELFLFLSSRNRFRERMFMYKEGKGKDR